MFKRRNKLPALTLLRHWIWPRRGWGRAGMYVLHRLSRLPGSGYSIASGFAFGAAISFTPFVGAHLLLGSAMAWVMRGNVLAAWIGTLVGNPWTFPFIWLWLYKFGNWMLARNGHFAKEPPDFTDVFATIWEASLVLDTDALAEGLSTVIWPMTVASVPSFIVIWFAFYFPVKYLVEDYKRRRRNRLRKKLRRKRSESADIGPSPSHSAP